MVGDEYSQCAAHAVHESIPMLLALELGYHPLKNCTKVRSGAFAQYGQFTSQGKERISCREP